MPGSVVCGSVTVVVGWVVLVEVDVVAVVVVDVVVVVSVVVVVVEAGSMILVVTYYEIMLTCAGPNYITLLTPQTPSPR